MKTIKLLSLSAVVSLPVLLSGCESLFSDDSAPRRTYASESYYHYDDAGSGGGGGSRSYGRGSSGSSKPKSERPSTSSTADSIEDTAAVPVEPPSLD